MKYSIIVPVFNSDATLAKCIESIRSAADSKAEIIIVNDGSVDGTRAVAEKFPCRLINLLANTGRAAARNIGAQQAKGDVLVFIDSDIMIPKDALMKVEQLFLAHPEAIAVNGILSADVEGVNFFSDYKNLYMNYHFKQNPDFIDFIFSSFVAIKKEYFLPFKPYRATDDTELGMRITQKYGKKIFLAKDIEVQHLKHYTLPKLLKNDFWVASDWALILKHRKSFFRAVQKRQFAHAQSAQIFSLGFVGVSLLCLALMTAMLKVGILGWLLFLIAALIARVDYFKFIFKKRGIAFLLKALPLFYIDSVAHFAGAVAGFLGKRPIDWDLDACERLQERRLVVASTEQHSLLRGETGFAPEVSVIIPSFNEEKNIEACLTCLMNQEAKCSYEVIVVDSSLDKTPEIVAQKFNRVRLVHHDSRLSCGEARNVGIEQAVGKKILFTDADVRVPPNWVEGMCKNLDKFDICAAPFINGTPYSISGTAGYVLEFFRFLPGAKIKEFIFGGNIGYRRSIIQDLKFTSGIGEDVIFNYTLTKQREATAVFDSSLAAMHLNKTGFRKMLAYQIKLGEGGSRYRRQLGLGPRLLFKWPFLTSLVPLAMIPRIIFQTILTKNYLLATYSILFAPMLLIANYFWAWGFYLGSKKK